MKIALIDNYDSFTFNVVHAIGALNVDVEVFRNDALLAQELLAKKHDAVVISPGPCTPNEAGISLDIIKLCAGKTPLLGICLGHQSIGQAFGGNVIRAFPIHGKCSSITHNNEGVFRGIPQNFAATRYHSLVVEEKSLPTCLAIDATSEDGLIMGLHHKDYPIYGVQFHPESIATEHGAILFQNFIDIVHKFYK